MILRVNIMRRHTWNAVCKSSIPALQGEDHFGLQPKHLGPYIIYTDLHPETRRLLYQIATTFRLTMTLKDLLTRKDRSNTHGSARAPEASPPEFTFMRTDTNTQEIITPPSTPSESRPSLNGESPSHSKRPFRFRSSSSASASSKDGRSERRLSSLLHLRSNSRGSSVNIPADLPNIDDTNEGQEEKEAQWEERATILAKENPNLKQGADRPSGTRLAPRGSISNAQGDVRTQIEA